MQREVDPESLGHAINSSLIKTQLNVLNLVRRYEKLQAFLDMLICNLYEPVTKNLTFFFNSKLSLFLAFAIVFVGIVTQVICREMIAPESQ